MTASLRLEHLRLALAHLTLAARAEPRAAAGLQMAIHETGHALNAADEPWTEEHDPAAFMSVKRAAAALAPLQEGSVRAAFQRHGAAVGIKDGRDVLVRADWVARQQAKRRILTPAR